MAQHEIKIPDYHKYDGEKVELMERATGPLAELSIKQSEMSMYPGSLVVLDNGCGHGVVTSRIFKARLNPHKLILGDFHEPMLDQALARAKREGWSDIVEGKIVDTLNIDFPDSTFTHIFTNVVLQLLGPQASQAVKECFRVLKPGGVHTFTTWQSIGWMNFAKKVFPDLAPPPIFDTPWARVEKTKTEMEKLGYVDVKVESTDITIRITPQQFINQVSVLMPALGVEENKKRFFDAIVDKYGENEFDLDGFKGLIASGKKPE